MESVPPPTIAVDRLTKRYGDMLAVDTLSFTVAPGAILGLVGPNGAGKTSTLRCLAGIIRPTTGRVALAGHDLATDPLPAKAALAFIPDEPQLFEYLTVLEHLHFVARLYHVADVEQRIPPLLDELELHDKQDALASELSRGMKQKLAIACGLIHSPSAIVLDEPLTGLDPVGIQRMRHTILERAKNGAAVVLSSHLLHLVEELCTHVLVLQRGKPIAYGTLADIRAQVGGRNLEEAFLSLTGHGTP